MSAGLLIPFLLCPRLSLLCPPPLSPHSVYIVRRVAALVSAVRLRGGWPAPLHPQVSTPELLEVMTVNAVGPFVLNSRLHPLMLRGPAADRYVVNVSAMEGKFYRYKTPNHPHTNMAKAALNVGPLPPAELPLQGHNARPQSRTCDQYRGGNDFYTTGFSPLDAGRSCCSLCSRE